MSRSYLDRLERLDKLEMQGDGVRSYASIIARVVTEGRSIQLIDEPEAFLHPPQARLVAASVALFSSGRQTVVATHSRDVLQGFIAEDVHRVSIIRLTRNETAPVARLLSSKQVEALWKDPILKFSNVLDGLFHSAVVVGESDSDCRFYESLWSQTVDPNSRPDLHFTYSGGKDRLPTVIAALRALHVPVVTIADFDVLNSEHLLRKIFEAHGGSWQAIRDGWLALKAAIEAKSAFISGDKLRNDLGGELKEITPGSTVSREQLGRMRNLIRRASPWDNVKNSGLAAVPAGGDTVSAKLLLQELARAGIFVAPVGELEGFCRDIGAHGTRWVEEALKRDLRADPAFSEARGFIAEIATFLAREVATPL